MSFERIFTAAIRDAEICEAELDAAIKKARFKSRFDWFLRGGHPSLQDAYNERVAAAGGAA